jgi:phosphotriesterase-related protein
MIRTVTGDIDAPRGPALVHEHLRIDLTSTKGPDTILAEAEEADVIADLRWTVGEHDLCLVGDLSVPGSGREPAVLQRVSRGAGVPVVCATGVYWDPLPPEVSDMSVAALRDMMVGEITKGIAGTEIRCGVIKIGTDGKAPTPGFQRVFEAAARAAQATGAAVITHTTKPDEAEWQMDALERAGADLRRVLISHLGRVDIARLARVARRGVFMGVDQIGFAKGPSYAQYADLVAAACREGLAGQLVLSSDMARRTRLYRAGGTSYGTVFSQFLPLLRERGVLAEQIDTMMTRNPARLFELAYA